MARRRRDDDAAIGMTPLIDVVLNLLIFYVVTTAFLDREIALQLPESQASSIPQEKKKLTIEVGRERGQLALDGKRVSIEALDQAVGAEARANRIRAVEIRADKLAVHGRVVEVMGIVKKHGVDSVGIAVTQPPARTAGAR
jgi:biopolymer transport protein ExbD